MPGQSRPSPQAWVLALATAQPARLPISRQMTAESYFWPGHTTGYIPDTLSTALPTPFGFAMVRQRKTTYDMLTLKRQFQIEQEIQVRRAT